MYVYVCIIKKKSNFRRLSNFFLRKNNNVIFESEKYVTDNRVKIEFARSLFSREIKHNLLKAKEVQRRVSKEFLTREIL